MGERERNESRTWRKRDARARRSERVYQEMVKNLPHCYSKYRWLLLLLLLHDWFYWIVFGVRCSVLCAFGIGDIQCMYIYSIDSIDNHWLYVTQFDCKTKAHESNNNNNRAQMNEDGKWKECVCTVRNWFVDRMQLTSDCMCALYANLSHEPQNQTQATKLTVYQECCVIWQPKIDCSFHACNERQSENTERKSERARERIHTRTYYKYTNEHAIH